MRSLLSRFPLVSSLFVQPHDATSVGTGFILTGAPAAGKTTLARCLEIGGEHVVHEAARDVFEYQRVALDTSEPWLLPGAQEHITRLQIAREGKAPHGSRFIMDRSVIDGAAFLILRGFSASTTAQALIASADVQRYNRRVFLVKSNTHIKGPGERMAVIEDSVKIENTLRLVYSLLGFELVDVPWLPINERCAFVKQQMAQPSEPLDWRRVRESLERREYLSWSCDI